MRFPLSIACGALFAIGALVAAAGTMFQAPRHALDAVRARLTACPLPGVQCAPSGVFLHQRTIGAPMDAALGPPDPNLLTSSAWVDLTTAPVRIDIPATADRFFAILVVDGRDRTTAIASPRLIGRDGGTLTLARSGQDAGADAVRVRTDWVWIIARFAVDGEPDAAAVNALQNALRITRLGNS